MLTSLLALATIVIKLWPETPLARHLHALLIQLPAARLAKMRLKHVVFVLLLVAALSVSSELLVVTGSADLAVGMLWNLAVYADAAAAVAAVALISKMRRFAPPVRACFLAFLVRMRAGRRRRIRAIRIVKRPAKGDEDPAWQALAAFA